jgi:hypothetical protein
MAVLGPVHRRGNAGDSQHDAGVLLSAIAEQGEPVGDKRAAGRRFIGADDHMCADAIEPREKS